MNENRPLTISAALLLAAAALLFPVRAYAVDDVPIKAYGVTPSEPTLSRVFQSRYSGVRFSYPMDWVARSETHGQAETVYLHPAALSPAPKAADYKLADFRDKRLIRLEILPKDSPKAPASLEALRSIQEEYLARQGVDFQFMGQGMAPAPGTFKVIVGAPHHYIQVFTHTPEHFLILTAGGGREVWDAYSKVVRSLEEYTDAFYTERDKWDASTDYKDPVLFFFHQRSLRFWKAVVWGVSAALLLILISWLGLFRPRLKYMGLAMLGFSFTLASAAFLLAYIPYVLHLPVWRNAYVLALVFILPIPWAARTLSDKLGGQSPRRVFWSAFALSVFFFAIGFEELTIEAEFSLGIILHAVYMLAWYGVFYGLAFGATFNLSLRKERNKNV